MTEPAPAAPEPTAAVPTAPVALDPAAANIQHVVVVMIENRSFDHLLGYLQEKNSAIEGLTRATQGNYVNQGPNGPVSPTPTASYTTLVDPGHELADVNQHLHSNAGSGDFGGNLDMGGFVASYASRVGASGFDAGGIMRCFDPSSLPALTRLAQEYAICDHWFASVPGPTLPNRLFVHAGTCLGYAKSPPTNLSIASVLALPHALANAMLKQAALNGVSEGLMSLGFSLESSGVSLIEHFPPALPLGFLEGVAGNVLATIGMVVGLFADHTDHFNDVFAAIENNVINNYPDLAYFLGRGDVVPLLGPAIPITYPQTIYEKLESTPGGAAAGWRVYFQDFSETLLIPFMRTRLRDELHFDLSNPIAPRPTGAFWNGQTGNFRTFHKFLHDALAGDLPRFSFVQPRMASVYNADDLVGTVRGAFHLSPDMPDISAPVANDAHPPHDVRDMEAFVVKVYDALRSSPAWPNTLLVITADEHGGFFDHVPPPSTQNPDGNNYSRTGLFEWTPGNFFHLSSDPSFRFDSLGVRVPGICISPYLEAGSVNKMVFDHTSIGATLRDLFQLGGPFTSRMASANPLTTGQKWTALRTDAISNVSRLLPPRSPGWQSLGGFGVDSPAVATNQDGRLELFVRAATGEIHHAWETTPGGAWSDWVSLAPLPSNVPGFMGVPSVASNADGRLEVFARGEDGSLQHCWQNTANGGWSGYAFLSNGLKGDPFAVANADGRLEVFYLNARGLCHRWQMPQTLVWADEAVLDPAATVMPTALDATIAASNQMALFGSWPVPDQPPRNDVLSVRWQESGSPGGWTGWSFVTRGARDPIAVRLGDGRLAVLALSYNSSINYLLQNAAGALATNSFGAQNGPFDDCFQSVTAARNADGWLDVIAFDIAGQVWATRHRAFGSFTGMVWEPWTLLGGPFAGRASLVLGKDGRMVVFVIGSDNNVWMRRQAEPGVWGAYATPASIDFGNQPLNAPSAPRAITISNPLDVPITITRWEQTGGFNCDLQVPATIPAGGSLAAHVTFFPFQAGAATGSILFSCGISGDRIAISLTGNGVSLAPVIAISPASVDFGRVAEGSSAISRTVTLTNQGASTLLVGSVTVDNPKFTIDTQPASQVAPQASTAFNVSYHPTTPASDQGAIWIPNDGGPPRIGLPGNSVAVSATTVAPATLTATPALVALGRVLAGGLGTKHITLTATSPTTVEISANGDGLDVSPSTLSIDTSASFTVTLDPPAPGPYHGTVTCVPQGGQAITLVVTATIVPDKN